MATDDDGELLAPENTHPAIAKPGRNASKRKGVSIFELGKGRFPEGTVDEEVKKHWTRAIASRRSSVSQSTSVLFSRGRDSRSGMQRLPDVDGDDMDIDELQANDVAFHNGSHRG